MQLTWVGSVDEWAEEGAPTLDLDVACVGDDQPGGVDVATQGAYDEATRKRPETLTDHRGVTSHRRGAIRHALEENRGLTLRDGTYGYEATGYQPGQKGLDPVDDLVAR